MSTGVEAKKRNRERKLGCRVGGGGGVVSMLPTTTAGESKQRVAGGCRAVCYPKKNQPSLWSWCLKKKKKRHKFTITLSKEQNEGKKKK